MNPLKLSPTSAATPVKCCIRITGFSVVLAHFLNISSQHSLNCKCNYHNSFMVHENSIKCLHKVLSNPEHVIYVSKPSFCISLLASAIKMKSCFHIVWSKCIDHSHKFYYDGHKIKIPSPSQWKKWGILVTLQVLIFVENLLVLFVWPEIFINITSELAGLQTIYCGRHHRHSMS